MKITLFNTIFSLICAAAFMIGGAGFAGESKALPAQTPYDKKYVGILWSTGRSDNTGVPVPDGETLLLPTLNKVKKLSEKDGSEIASVELDEKVSTRCSGAVLDGKLIQPGRTSVYAVNTDDMSVISSRKFGDITTDIGITSEYAYFGYKTDDGYKFVCAGTENEFETLWEYSSKDPVTSPAVFNDFAVFGSGERLVVHGAENEKVSEIEIGSEITNVFAGKYAIFMTSSDGCLYKLRLTDDGAMEPDTLMKCEIGGSLTAPAELENQVYVGSDKGFFVIDGLNMEIRESFTEMKNASAPVITTGNGVRVYTAAPHADNAGERWYLYSILDSGDALTVGEVAKIIDFNDGKTAVSVTGKMYFRDARGQVWALAETHPSVFMMILKAALMLVIIILLILIVKTYVKRKNAKRPPQY